MHDPARVTPPLCLLLLLSLLLLAPLQCSAHSYAIGMPIPMLKRSQYKGVSEYSGQGTTLLMAAQAATPIRPMLMLVLRVCRLC